MRDFEDRYITIAEAMKILGVSKSKITSLMNEGLLRHKDSILDKRRKLVSQQDVYRIRNGERGDEQTES